MSSRSFDFQWHLYPNFRKRPAEKVALQEIEYFLLCNETVSSVCWSSVSSLRQSVKCTVWTSATSKSIKCRWYLTSQTKRLGEKLLSWGFLAAWIQPEFWQGRNHRIVGDSLWRQTVRWQQLELFHAVLNDGRLQMSLTPCAKERADCDDCRNWRKAWRNQLQFHRPLLSARARIPHHHMQEIFLVARRSVIIVTRYKFSSSDGAFCILVGQDV